MWDKVVKALSQYPSAILTGLDANGYPFSQRCKPQPDVARQVLTIEPFGETRLQTGPASLLCHSYNEEVWNLKSAQVLGRLEAVDQGWVFIPERLLSGMGQSPIDQFQMIRNGQVESKKYLEKRGLPRPKIAWDEIKALQAEGKKRKK